MLVTFGAEIPRKLNALNRVLTICWASERNGATTEQRLAILHSPKGLFFTPAGPPGTFQAHPRATQKIDQTGRTASGNFILRYKSTDVKKRTFFWFRKRASPATRARVMAGFFTLGGPIMAQPAHNCQVLSCFGFSNRSSIGPNNNRFAACGTKEFLPLLGRQVTIAVLLQKPVCDVCSSAAA